MPGALSTDWISIATSGPTADGREIKKEWLTDMAANYDPSLYCAKLWLDHYRFYGAQGDVLELKTEKATSEKLKGEIQLFAKLSPNAELVSMNREGQYRHCSIEPLENFAGKGFTYLGGIGITDYPASLGTHEAHFNNQKRNTNYFSAGDIDLSTAQAEREELGILDQIKALFKSSHQPEQDTEMKPEQFAELLAAQNKTNEALISLTELFSKKPPVVAPKEGEQTTQAESVVTAEQFAALQNENKTLTDKFTALEAQFNGLKTTPVPGTVPGTNDGGAQEETL